MDLGRDSSRATAAADSGPGLLASRRSTASPRRNAGTSLLPPTRPILNKTASGRIGGV
ncbi:hypothetical protein GCM10027184_36630 [Saccharothrix stipae]